MLNHIISALRYLFPSIYNYIFICLMNPNLIELVGREHLHHVVPDINSQVLSCATGPKREKNEDGHNVNMCDKNLVKKDSESSWQGHSPDNTGKVWNIFIQVFMVQWSHNDVLQEENHSTRTSVWCLWQWKDASCSSVAKNNIFATLVCTVWLFLYLPAIQGADHHLQCYST